MMKDRIIHEKMAMVKNTGTEQEVEAEVGEFRLEESLNAYLAGTKIHMKWNGKLYVGNIHGMELTTEGPITRTIRPTRGL